VAVLPANRSSPSEGPHLVLYDGVCGLCNHLLQFVLKHDSRAVFRFASLQSPLGVATVARSGGDPQDLSSLYVVADFREPHAHVFTRSDAALFVTRELGWPWRMISIAGLLPSRFRDRVYDIIALSRYRIFGRYEQCVLPSTEWRSRFIEEREAPFDPEPSAQRDNGVL
jgi:predicted DCC family thiol-disulfide oxidoreductase YuxK